MYMARAKLKRGECLTAIRMFREISQALDDSRAINYFLGLPVLPAAFARGSLGAGLAEIGAFAEAETQTLEAARRADASGQPALHRCRAYWNTGLVALIRGASADAVGVFDHLLDLCTTHDLDATIRESWPPSVAPRPVLGQSKRVSRFWKRRLPATPSPNRERPHTFALTALA